MKFCILLIVLVIICLVIPGFHFFKTDTGWHVIMKDNWSLRDTVVNTTDWKVGDYMDHAPAITNYVLKEKGSSFKKKILDSEEYRRAKKESQNLKKKVGRWLREVGKELEGQTK